jgi:hypothetical protein
MRQTKSLPECSMYYQDICRLLQAPAEIWPFPTLSLRSLYGRLGPYPATTQRCFFVHFFPLDIGLPFGLRGSAREKLPQRNFMWETISRLQPFVYLQAPILAWPTDCSDHQGSMPTRPPSRIHRAVLTPLPVASSGITTCPNWTIDTTGLVKVFTFTHLLDRNLVGCS